MASNPDPGCSYLPFIGGIKLMGPVERSACPTVRGDAFRPVAFMPPPTRATVQDRQARSLCGMFLLGEPSWLFRCRLIIVTRFCYQPLTMRTHDSQRDIPAFRHRKPIAAANQSAAPKVCVPRKYGSMSTEQRGQYVPGHRHRFSSSDTHTTATKHRRVANDKLPLLHLPHVSASREVP